MSNDKEQMQKLLESALHLVDDKALDSLGLSSDEKKMLQGMVGRLRNKENLSMQQKMAAMALLERLSPKAKGSFARNPEMQNMIQKVMEQAKGTDLEKQLQQYINQFLR